MSATIEQDLFARADQVRAHAYAPYSGFHVGAAILDAEGALFTGCNVENAAYPIGACAEANAIGAMVAARGPGARIAKIAIVGGPAAHASGSCAPCGGCRQRIAEFAAPGAEILLRAASGGVQRFSLPALLPAAFTAGDLGREGP